MARFKIIEKQAEQTNNRFKIINPVEITQPITKITNTLETAKADYNAQLKKEAEQKSALKTKLESSGVTLGDNNFYTPNNLTTTKKILLMLCKMQLLRSKQPAKWKCQ